MDKVVLITGVFGGIGYATARVFSNAGWRVIGVDRQVKEDDEGFLDYFIQKDISKAENIDTIFARIREKYSVLNCLVNNAALQVAKSILDTTADEWDLVFQSNVRSVFIAVKHAHDLLKKTKGSIVNVSSVHAYATSKNISAYAASKGALLAFTRSLALEFCDDSIRVNCVIPGAVNTNMLTDGLSRGHFGEESLEVMIDKLGMRHPVKRVGDPEDIGKLIFFLADNDQSSFITGQSFIADGGALAQLSTEV